MTRDLAARPVRLSWERVQLVVTLGTDTSEAPAPEALRLWRDDRPQPAVAPVRAWREDDVVVACFNVMLGPGQRPLEPGSRWLLAVVDAERDTPVPLRLVDQGPGPEPALFWLRRGRYEVVPAIRPPDGRLELVVRFSPGTPPWVKDTLLERVRLALTDTWRVARVIVLRFVLALLRSAIRRNGRRILFMSDYGSDLTDNLALVYDRMVERGLDREYELLTLTRRGPYAGRGLVGRLRLPWLVARADTVVIDKDQPALHRAGDSRQRIIQLWHSSGAIKTVGYSRVGRPYGPNPWSRTHKDYAYAIVSGDHDVPLYAEAFGIPEERVVPTGIPRMDRFFDPAAREAGREAALAALPAARDRMVILYAPTFRGKLREAAFDMSVLDLPRLHELCVEKDAVFIIRLHPHVRQRPVIPADLGDRVLDGSSATMGAPDLLFATDLLITDYSSILFEYATLGRPMLFYAYDLEEYEAERDVYVPYEEFVPGKVIRTFDELLEAIRRDDYDVEKVAAFAERHFRHRDGRATDRVVELVLGR